MQTFAEIIDAFPDGALADHLKVGRGHVAVWKHRNRIPAEYWLDVVAAAQAQEPPLAEITAELLTLIEARRSGRAA